MTNRSYSAPGTKWSPEMKTVWNSVLLTRRLALLLRLPSRGSQDVRGSASANPGTGTGQEPREAALGHHRHPLPSLQKPQELPPRAGRRPSHSHTSFRGLGPPSHTACPPHFWVLSIPVHRPAGCCSVPLRASCSLALARAHSLQCRANPFRQDPRSGKTNQVSGAQQVGWRFTRKAPDWRGAAAKGGSR